MLSPLLSYLSDSDRDIYLSNEKEIQDAEKTLLSNYEVVKDFENKLKEARLHVLNTTQTLKTLYDKRQISYDMVFKKMNISVPKPKCLTHHLKKDCILRECNAQKKIWGSNSFIDSCVFHFPVYEESDDGCKEVSHQDAFEYWSKNLHKLTISK
jgi:hypothetical protein